MKASKPASFKAKNAKTKKVKATWKAPKHTAVDGYTVQYRIKGKKWTTKTTTKTSYTVKGKKGKTYQVRVRGYKTVAGKKVNTTYSAKKTVKVKK